MKMKENFDQWLQTSKSGDKLTYYKGFYVCKSFKDVEMRRFSKYLLNLAYAKPSIVCLYQKKIDYMEYEYIAEKR